MIKVPSYVKETIMSIRDSGVINMFDRNGVINIAEQINPDAAEFLTENKRHYIHILENSVSKDEDGTWLND